jgi:hypothetical protein
MKLITSLVLVLASGACVYRGNPEAERLCEWREDDRRPLDLRSSADRAHLRDDAIAAEDLAIGHADRHARSKTQSPTGATGYHRMRTECMDRLFANISTRHNVSSDVVREYHLHRNLLADVAVIGMFALLYCLAAYLIAGYLFRRFAADGFAVFLGASVLISLAVAAAGTVLGEIWSVWFEAFRLGRGHLSYRMNRIPWVQYRFAAFIAGIAAFWLVSAVRYRRAAPQSPVNRHISTPPADPYERRDEPADTSQRGQQVRITQPFQQMSRDQPA